MLQLFDYQQAAIDKFKSLTQEYGHKRFYLGFKMGLGKTICSLAYFSQIGQKHFLIITKSTLFAQWKKAYAQVFGNADNLVTLDKPGDEFKVLEEDKVYLLSYDRFTKLLEASPPYRVNRTKTFPFKCHFIFDESQILKSPKSKISKTMLAHQGRFENVLLLSGSLIGNNLQDAYVQWRLLNDNNISHWDFLHSYFIIKPTPFNKMNVAGIDRRKAQKLIEQIDAWSVFKNATFDEPINYITLEDYQPINYQTLRQQALIYKNLNFMTLLDSPLKRSAAIRQGLSGFYYGEPIDDAVIEQMEQIGQLQLQSTDDFIKRGDNLIIAKKHKKYDLLLDKLKDEQPYLIFHNYTAERDIIAALASKAGYQLYFLNGTQSAKEREKALEEINAHKGDSKWAVIANLQAASTGIDGLQHKLNNIIYFSLPYSYEAYSQANARLYRHGQDKATNVFILITHPFEQMVFNNLKRYERNGALLFEQDFFEFFGQNDKASLAKQRSRTR